MPSVSGHPARLPERIDPQTWRGIAPDLAIASERCDIPLLLSCLRRLSVAYGVTEVARQTGIDRVSLYRMFNRPSNPKIGNVVLLLDLFGIRLQFSVLANTGGLVP